VLSPVCGRESDNSAKKVGGKELLPKKAGSLLTYSMLPGGHIRLHRCRAPAASVFRADAGPV
jgi:hypothetical protein